MYYSDRDISSCVYMQTCIRDSQKQPSECFMKKFGLKNFAKFAGKHLCQGLFFNSVYPSSSSNLKNKESLRLYRNRDLVQVFYCEFCEIFKNSFFKEHLRAAISTLNLTTLAGTKFRAI